jgi:hypothetical protein
MAQTLEELSAGSLIGWKRFLKSGHTRSPSENRKQRTRSKWVPGLRHSVRHHPLVLNPSFEQAADVAVRRRLRVGQDMVHESSSRNTIGDHAGSNSFEVAARAHLESLEGAGETPEQIVRQLSDVAASYSKDGLQDEASALREIIRRYQIQWAKGGERPS